MEKLGMHTSHRYLKPRLIEHGKSYQTALGVALDATVRCRYTSVFDEMKRVAMVDEK